MTDIRSWYTNAVVLAKDCLVRNVLIASSCLPPPNG